MGSVEQDGLGLDDSAAHCAMMPLTAAAFELGTAFETASRVSEESFRDIAMAEWHYYRAEPESCAALTKPYLESPNPRLRLSACWLYGYASLSLGNIAQARFALASIKECLQSVLSEGSDPDVKAEGMLVATGAAVLLHLPAETLDRMVASMSHLTEGLRLFASYVLAHQAYLDGDYGKSVGIAEGALAFSGERYPIPSIYLHLIAVMGHISMRQQEEAEAHFDRAWELASPDGLLEPFAEHHGLIQGMLERRVKKDHPEEFKRVIETTYRFAAGWRLVHNPTTKSEVADNLTTTQFSVAMLACRGWTNKEIAPYLGISESTVKAYLSEVYAKLGISSRGELTRYMLR